MNLVLGYTNMVEDEYVWKHSSQTEMLGINPKGKGYLLYFVLVNVKKNTLFMAKYEGEMGTEHERRKQKVDQ